MNKELRRLLSIILCLSLLFSWNTITANAQTASSLEEIRYGTINYKDLTDETNQISKVSQFSLSALTTNSDNYYQDQLSDVARTIYQAMEDSITTMYSGTAVINVPCENGIFTVSNVSEAFHYVMDAFMADHTDVFWVQYSNLSLYYSYYESSGTVIGLSIQPSSSDYYVPDCYTYSSGTKLVYFGGNTPFVDSQSVETAINQINTKVQECIDKTTGCTTDYEKVKVIHDWLSNHIEYDTNYYDQHLYSAIIYGKAVCAGYAGAFDYIAQKVGITTIQVSGKGKTSPTVSENHAWNLVKIDGLWYGMDVTWDDQTENNGKIYYDYFLAGADTISSTFYHVSFNTSHIMNNYFSDTGITFHLPFLNSTVYSPSASAVPTATPTVTPTITPTVAPTLLLTAIPTVTPTLLPTTVPTVTPTLLPSATPTVMPTSTPTVTPIIRVSNPISDLSSGSYFSEQEITLRTDTEGAVIYYTTDGSIPTRLSLLYEGKISIAQSITLKIMAIKEGMEDSEIVEYNYEIILPSASPTPLPVTTPQPEPTSSQKPLLTGDIDDNGSIDLTDAQMALKAALNIILLDDTEKIAADVDGESGISLLDAQMILKAALNILSL